MSWTLKHNSALTVTIFSSSCLETACYKLRVVSMFFVKTSLLWEPVHAMCHMFTQNSPFYTGKTLINPFDSGIFAEKTPFKASRGVFLSVYGQKEANLPKHCSGLKLALLPERLPFAFSSFCAFRFSSSVSCSDLSLSIYTRLYFGLKIFCKHPSRESWYQFEGSESVVVVLLFLGFSLACFD